MKLTSKYFLKESCKDPFTLKQPLKPTAITLSSASFYWFYLVEARSSWTELLMGGSSSLRRVLSSVKNKLEPPRAN